MRLLELKAPRLFALALLLAAFGGSTLARGRVLVDVNVGFPFAAPPFGGVGISVGAGHGNRGHWHGRHGRGYGGWHGGWHGWAPGVVLVAPPLVGYGTEYGTPVYLDQPLPSARAERPPVSVPATRPDPVIYPRTGQSGQQTEYDRQECNRWATTQQAALADAGVFQRAVEACMDGRGYSMR